MKILLIDDEKNIRTTLQIKLTDWKHDVTVGASLKDAAFALENKSFDLVLTDYRLGVASGSDVIHEVMRRQSKAVIIVMTAYSSIQNAIDVTRDGAFDYLQKPFTNEQLAHVIDKASKFVKLIRENEELRRSKVKSNYFDGMTSPAMRRLEQFVNQVASTDHTVLITGESGTGKTELAHLIHYQSKRREKQLIAIHCSSIFESPLETELFGDKKAIPSGSIEDRTGKLEQADGGTLYFDEIGDLSSIAQNRLLRFLETKILERGIGVNPIRINTRVIVSTCRNLAEAVENGSFREDLYYRLNMLQCDVVPLRHRKEDLPLLIERFLQDATISNELDKRPQLPRAVFQKLLDCQWRGNLRELKNAIDRMVILGKGKDIEFSDLPETILNPKPTAAAASDYRQLDEIEREHILSVLSAEPNFDKAAKILGITTVTLWRKRKQYGL